VEPLNRTRGGGAARPSARSSTLVDAVRDHRDLFGQVQLFRRAQELADLGTHTIDLDRRIVVLSRETAIMFRASDDEIAFPLDEYRRRFLHPDDLAAVAGAAEASYGRGGSQWLSTRIVRGDGQVIWIRARSAVEQAEDGRRFVLGVVQDITELVQAREHTQLLAALVQASDDAIVTADLDGRITSWNPGAERVYGYSVEEVLGQNLASVTLRATDTDEAKREVEAQQERLRRLAARQTLRNVVAPRRRKDGTPFIISASAAPLQDDDGGVVGMVLIGRDVTDIEHANARVKDSEARFRALVQHGSDVIAVVDADGIFRYMSPSVTGVTGRDADGAIGQPFTRTIHPDDVAEVEGLFRLVLGCEGSTQSLSYRVVGKHGAVRHIEALATNLTHLPEVRGVVFNARDVTDAVDYREQLAHRALHDELTGLPNRALFVDPCRAWTPASRWRGCCRA
jgi:PAS domain S-box-containing protein